MREILFKAKRIDNGEWVEGNLVFLFQTKVHEAFIIPIKFGNAFMQLREGDLGFRYWYKVDKETLCQFTGLCDKNGNKIWENDIFQYTDETMVNQKDLIEYNETHASFVRLRNTEKLGLRYLWIDEATCNHGEVIGNIFDNPELLQEESDE
jgi:uncharacterized phage protein (TIGR01671 family)